MKRFWILLLVTLVPVAGGCCRGWPRMMMYRGDVCDPCASASPVAPIYEGAAIPVEGLPGPSLPLPGPVETSAP